MVFYNICNSNPLYPQLYLYKSIITLKNIVTMISETKSWYFGGILQIILFIFALFNLKYTYVIYLFSIYSICFISVYILSVKFAKYIVQCTYFYDHSVCNVYILHIYFTNTLYVLQGYPQRMRHQRQLYWICFVHFLAFRVHCMTKLAYFWA